MDAGNTDKKAIRVDIPDIISVSASADLTLPPGAGLCINTTSGQVFLVSIMLYIFVLIAFFLNHNEGTITSMRFKNLTIILCP